MTKLVFILNHFHQTSINNQVLTLINHANKKNFNFYVFILNKIDPIFYNKLKKTKAKVILLKDKPFFKKIITIFKEVKKIKPQLIHTHTLQSEFIAIFIKIFFKLNKKFKFVTISSRHNDLFSPLKIKNIIKNFFYFLFCHLTDINVCVNRYLQKKITTKLVVPKKKTFYIPNGVIPLKKISNKLTIQKVKILFTGQLIKRKNLSHLLNILNHLKNDFSCYIVGSGPELNYLKHLTKKLNLEKKVVFTGRKKDCQIYLKKSNIFILPSYSEGLSYSLLEAMNYGLACIVSDIPANKNIITHSKNGLKFSLKEKPETTAKKIDLLINDKEKIKSLGLKAHQTIDDFYNQQKMLKTYYQKFTSWAKSCQSNGNISNV